MTTTIQIPETVINGLAECIRNSIEWLKSQDCGCCRFIIPNSVAGTVDEDEINVAIYIGWSDGYDEKHEGLIHSKHEPSYCINAGLKIRNDWDWTDYDYLNFPYRPDTSDCWDTDTSIAADATLDDFKAIAKNLLTEFCMMVAESQKEDTPWVFA